MIGRNNCVESGEVGNVLQWFFRFSDNRVCNCGISWYSENRKSFVESVFIDHSGSYFLF